MLFDTAQMYEQVKKLAPCKESLEWLKSLPPELTLEQMFNELDVMPEGPEFIVRWAIFIIKDRVREGEPIIMKDPKAAVAYATHILKDRWIEAENNIMLDPQQAYHYASNVIKGRWEEAEPYIRHDSKYWNFYKTEIIDGLVREVEDGAGEGGDSGYSIEIRSSV